MKKTVLTLAFIMASIVSYSQHKFMVEVTVKNITNKAGIIYATLTDDSQSFPSVAIGKRQQVEVTNEEIILKFTDVPEGNYAVVLFQDLNGNQSLDMNGQMPAEPFGFSNITMLMGPPDFASCSFKVKENTFLDIRLISF